MDRVTMATLDKGQKNVQLLVQPQYSPMAVEKQIAILYCGTHGLLKDVPLDKVRAFEKDFLEALEINHQEDVLNNLAKGVINDDITKILESIADQISRRYK